MIVTHSLTFGGEKKCYLEEKKIMLGVLNVKPLVDLATDVAKASCKTLDLKEGKSVVCLLFVLTIGYWCCHCYKDCSQAHILPC